MTYVTLGDARAAASARGLTASASAQLRKAAAAAPPNQQYDFFLSHSHEDAAVIAGVKAIIEAERRSVYVYWAEGDVGATVDAQTASKLRVRMNNCKALIFASSNASTASKWMPWELGYFDGRKPEKVAIMPLIGSSASAFVGQEYLKLYPELERINWSSGSRGLGIMIGTTVALSLSAFLSQGATLRP